MICIENMSLAFGEQKIFENVTISIGDSKIGIVGNNGAGKSTFFKLLLGELLPDDGKIRVKGKQRIALLPQVIDDFEDDLTVIEYLRLGRPIQELENNVNELYEKLMTVSENEQEEIYARISELTDELSYWNQYEAESELAKIVSGMSISDKILKSHVRELSGGQKSKVAFAKLLYTKPEYMLLDEPTNHLDVETKKFVSNYLKSYKGSVLVISHDVEFLDEVVEHILFFDIMKHSIEMFNCNYSKFVKLHEEHLKSLDNQVAAQQRELEKLRQFVLDNRGVSGKRAKKVHDREKKIERIEKNELVSDKKQRAVKIVVQQNRESNAVPISIDNLCFKYPTTKMFINNLSISITRGEKILIVGENGVGKSTLLKLIIGQLTPIKGQIKLGTRTDISYYAQEHELLDLDKTIIENFSSSNITQRKLRAFLSNFLFTGDTVLKEVSVLSPGERSRVALAKLALQGANVLLLDEPTNHLDPITQRVIAETFSTFNGTMLVVSHNLEFADNLGIDRMLILPQGKICYYDKEVVEYYSMLNEQNK